MQRRCAGYCPFRRLRFTVPIPTPAIGTAPTSPGCGSPNIVRWSQRRTLDCAIAIAISIMTVRVPWLSVSPSSRHCRSTNQGRPSPWRRESCPASVPAPRSSIWALPAAMDDSEFTGYRRDARGEFRLSYGFRDTSGYRFRTSLAGRVYYWLLDHSQVARIINARKNSGLLTEWSDQAAAAPAQRREPSLSCAPTLLDDQLALWRDGKPTQFEALLRAFLRDLAAIRLSQGFPIIIATSGVEARCPSLAAKRAALVEAMRARIEAASLQLIDLDARVLAKVGPSGVARLRGFGAGIGSGHLNVEGNRVYGEVFADIIRTTLAGHS